MENDCNSKNFSPSIRMRSAFGYTATWSRNISTQMERRMVQLKRLQFSDFEATNPYLLNGIVRVSGPKPIACCIFSAHKYQLAGILINIDYRCSWRILFHFPFGLFDRHSRHSCCTHTHNGLNGVQTLLDCYLIAITRHITDNIFILINRRLHFSPTLAPL